MDAVEGSGGGSESVARPSDDRQPDVKRRFTRKRPKREVETLEYIAAAQRFIRAAGNRVGEGDEHELQALMTLQASVGHAIREAVRGQLAHGKSWARIALGTGTTREAAFQRWRDKA